MDATGSLGPIEEAVRAGLARLLEDDVVGRIWLKDHTVWKPDPDEIADRLGWLTVADAMREQLDELGAFAERAVADGYTRVVLCGMGGSSLAPEVMRRTLGRAPGALELIVLDSTHPATVARVAAGIDPAGTLFLIASKSGTTIETLSHLASFDALTDGAMDRFVAITDPGSPLETTARERGFRAVWSNPSDIGGRYSALSLFGLVPAALLGADLKALLDAADGMAKACARPDGPGAWLGVVIGEAARAGRDKLTLLFEPGLASLGGWIEQLIAESTGKQGTGVLPVVGEPAGDRYGDDRLFVAVGEVEGLSRLISAGHPVVRIEATIDDLGAEFFRWEFATAVAGHVLGIQPFDQPNVAEAKAGTQAILTDGASDERPPDSLARVLATIKPGDYVALLAYLDPTPAAEHALQRVRATIRDRYDIATTLGFGPRYLHSTGQLHKGGPPGGVFVVVVDAGRDRDVPVPGAPYTFGALLDAQAAGDLRSLTSRGRRVARVTPAELEETIG